MFVVTTFILPNVIVFDMKILSRLIVFLPLLFTLSCSETGVDYPGSRNSVNGSIQKGPFVEGSTISIQELDDNLNPTGKYYSTTTKDDFGRYSLGSEIGSKYVEIIADGYYYNECTGQISNSPITLRAISDVSGTSDVNVNLLTTLESERIRNLVRGGTSIDEARKRAEREVLAVFGINRGSDAGSFDRMDLGGSSEDDAILIAVSVMLQAGRSEGELSELYSKIANSLAESGVSGGFGYDSYRQDLDLINVIRAIRDIYHTDVPDFWRYMDVDGDGQVGDTILLLEQDSFDVPKEGGVYNLVYTAAAEGSFYTSENDWIHIADTKAVNRYGQQFTVDQNSSARLRTGTIDVRSSDGSESREIQVVQRPDTAAQLVIEPYDGQYWKDYLGMMENVAIVGQMQHDTLALIGGLLGECVLDMSEMTTDDGIIGLEESFNVPVVYLPVEIETIYSDTLVGAEVEIMNWKDLHVRRLIINGYETEDPTIPWLAHPNGLFNGGWRPEIFEFPAMVEEICGPMFNGWSWLKSLSIPDSVKVLNGHALCQNCEDLEYVKLPAGMNVIGNYAFQGDLALKEIVMPDVDELTLGMECFANTFFLQDWGQNNKKDHPLEVDLRRYKKLNSTVDEKWQDHDSAIYLFNAHSNTLKSMLSSVYEFQMGLYCNDPVVDEKTFAEVISSDPLNKVRLVHFGPDVDIIDGAYGQVLRLQGRVEFDNPDTRFGENAFSYCGLIEQVPVPKSMNKIPNGCFEGAYSAIDNGIDYLSDYFVTPITLEIPDHITAIGHYAYSHDSRIESVVIPKNVKTIGSNAFEFCYYTYDDEEFGLKEITFSSGMAEIPEYCCYMCSRLTSDGIHIPSSVKRIGWNAFSGCNITSLDFLPNTLDEYPLDAIGAYRADTIIVPEGIKTVSALGYELRARRVVLPKSLTELPPAFSSGNRTIEEIELSEGLNRLSLGSFCGAENLEKIILPASLNYIDGSLSVDGDPLISTHIDLYLKVTAPPQLEDNIYDANRQTLTIYIPKGSLSAYKASAEWAKYASILVETTF